MQETFSSGGKLIRIDVHEPPTPASHAPAILLLHGAGGNISHGLSRIAPQLLSAGVAVYAPHYFERTGTTFADLATITDGKHVPLWLETLNDALTWIANRPSVDPSRIAFVGISLGAFLSLSFAAQLSASPDPERRSAIRCIVDVSGGLAEPFASLATPSFPPTLILHGEADNVVPVSSAHELDRLLTRLGVLHETRVFPGEGHWFTSATHMQLLLAIANFLSQHLQLQPLRP